MTVVTQSLLEMVRDQSPLSADGFHSLDHWVRVLANGRKLTETTGANLTVVELFAVFHDSRRLNEGHDPEHGIRGATFASEMRGEWFEINDDEMGLLIQACEEHSNGHTNADITVQTCWDADRLDLGRVGTIPNPKYLCTDAAKKPEMINWAHERAIKLRRVGSHQKPTYTKPIQDADIIEIPVQPKLRKLENPKSIVSDLLKLHGSTGAIEIAAHNIAEASTHSDNYQLSIWREVRNMLRNA
jgi:uncharacterized protein